MSKSKAWILILAGLVLALGAPFVIRGQAPPKQTRTITLTAEKYGYSPARLVVNKGDTIVLRPSSKDATHGFLLDGYPVEFTMRKGATFLKYSWEEEGKIQSDWDRVDEVSFKVDKPGKYTFRCTQTCGNLHPFMTGELIVKPNNPYYLMVSLSVWLVFSLLVYAGSAKGTRSSTSARINLTERWPWLKRLLKARGFQFFVILPNFIVFYLFILSSLWGSPVGNRNIAIIFVWILWWFVLKAIIVPLGGRIWCLVCPLPAPAEWLSRMRLTAVRYFEKPFKSLHHRFFGLQKDWPKPVRNIWLQNILFLALISFGIILITRPIATAFMFLGILVLSLVLGFVYRRRVFCQYLCPVGGFLGTYSMASMTEIRAIDPEICRKHKNKACYSGGPNGWACPWGQYIGNMNRNNYCGLCTECLKSCPKDNIGVLLRPFGSDRKFKGYDEMVNAAIMLAVAIAFSVTMLGPWGFIKTAANVTESRQLVPYFTYIAAVWGLALGLIPGLVLFIGRLSHYLAGKPVERRTMVLRLGYILVPIGIFAWIAFSLPPIMINYNYILSVLSDPLGLGWNIFGTAYFGYAPLWPEWIPVIQGIVLLIGLYFGISRTYFQLRDMNIGRAARFKALVPPALFALLMVNFFLKLYLG